MKEERYHIALDDYEQGIVIRSLNDERTSLIEQDKPTEDVDDLIIKIGNAPKRRVKVVERNEERLWHHIPPMKTLLS